ncbi:MAG: aminotransferase class III-fold pyridoxal phosphate-dependent enzyme [Verrucomicrobiota bacterium]
MQITTKPSKTSKKAETFATYDKSMELFGRARQVIPGGIYGHTTPTLVGPGASPYYAVKGKGSRYWDVDGNEFIDYMCGYGPIVQGYNHPEIETAAEKQRKRGDCFNHPGSVMIDLAEKLVELVDFADWCVFGKNGSDMTSWATQVAREYTTRKKILMVRGAYHGVDPWCTPGHGGLIEEDRAHIHYFDWNDPQSFIDQVKQHPNQVAAVITTPYHHPTFADSVMPSHDFLKTIREQCDEHGILWILDDVRSGFRLNIGGSHRYFDFQPDIACYCKAIANGYPLSACVGKNDYKISATKVFLTGSYWGGAVSMAAALKNIEILERDHALETMDAMGDRLFKGFKKKAKAHGLQITMSGPHAIPFMTFRNETNFFRLQHFAEECLKRGAFIHPHHNWFLSAAHTEADIDATIEIADAAFASVKEKFGS